MSEPVITAMRDALKISQKQYDAYIKGHLEGRTKAVSDSNSRNKLPLFVSLKEKIKVKTQISSLMSDFNLCWIVHFMPDERW